MKEIKLTNGGVTLVDDSDYEELNQYKWFAHKERDTAYVLRYQYNGFRQYGRVLMHRQILNPEKSDDVDHVNGDGLDNQRSNIRVCSRQQNLENQRLRSDNTSGFKGVSLCNKNRAWRATVNLNGKQVHVGCYPTKEAAAQAYNHKAIELFGQFARSNAI